MEGKYNIFKLTNHLFLDLFPKGYLEFYYICTFTLILNYVQQYQTILTKRITRN